MPEFPFGGDYVWWPDPQVVERTNLMRFMRRHGKTRLDDLIPRSLDEVAWFWDAVLADLDIRFYQPYRQIVDFSQGIERPVWCAGGTMNIVHNCLDRWLDGSAAGKTALRWEGEEGSRRILSYRELAGETNRAANALRRLGCKRGDAVGIFMPMVPETVVALLAIAKIGGIIVPLFSGYGAGRGGLSPQRRRCGRPFHGRW